MIKVWQLDDRGQIRLLHVFTGRSRVTAVALLEGESTMVSGHADGQLRFWEFNNTHGRDVLRGHANIVRCVDVSPDGRLVASGGVDKTLRIWDLQAGKVDVLERHAASVRRLDFSPDGTLIATAGWDRRVIL